MYVHDHHGGLESRCKEDRFLAVDGFADDLEVAIALDHFTQNPPNERMVIHEKNLYWLRMRRLAVFVEHASAPIRCVSEENCTSEDAGVLLNHGNATKGALLGHTTESTAMEAPDYEHCTSPSS